MRHPKDLALAKLNQHIEAAELLFRGLADELPRAIVQNRLPEWRAAAESIIALIANEEKWAALRDPPANDEARPPSPPDPA
jgi:hypothetical protein